MRFFAAVATLLFFHLSDAAIASPIAGLAEPPSAATAIGAVKVGIDVGGFSYQSSTGALHYSSPILFSASNYFDFLSGEFSWSASLSSTGEIQGGGVAQLSIVRSDGSQFIIATAETVDFGFLSVTCFERFDTCTHLIPSATFQIVSVDRQYAHRIGNWWQWIGSFSIDIKGGSFLEQDVVCGITHGCSPFSTSDLIFFVPEPGSLSLLLTGLVAFASVSSRKVARLSTRPFGAQKAKQVI